MVGASRAVFFQEQVKRFADIEPLAVEFVPDRLRGSPLFFYSAVLKVLTADAARLGGVQHQYFGRHMSYEESSYSSLSFAQRFSTMLRSNALKSSSMLSALLSVIGGELSSVITVATLCCGARTAVSSVVGVWL